MSAEFVVIAHPLALDRSRHLTIESAHDTLAEAEGFAADANAAEGAQVRRMLVWQAVPLVSLRAALSGVYGFTLAENRAGVSLDEEED